MVINLKLEQNTPAWCSTNKRTSIREWGSHLHIKSKHALKKDKTHPHTFFLFDDKGPTEFHSTPLDTDPTKLNEATVNAVKSNNLYAVIHVGVMHLKNIFSTIEEREREREAEYLHFRMENRDGDCVIYLDEIIRDGDNATLGLGKTICNEPRKWF